MRSPIIAFSIMAAAAAVSPTLGAPTSPNPAKELQSAVKHVARQAPIPANNPANSLPVLGAILGGSNNNANSNTPAPSRDAHRAAEAKVHSPPPPSPADAAAAMSRKRSGDEWTAGGNAYSGATQDTSGGSIINAGNDDPEFGGGVFNDDGSNDAGSGGEGFSGFSFGGNGDGKGPGGNAYTGAVGPSRGGSVINTGGEIENGEGEGGANFAGDGGFNESGDANGGDAGPEWIPPPPRKRAGDENTAGGNAYSGASSDVDGGSIVNNAQENEGELTNDGGNVAGDGGETFSGFAFGGDGNGFGPGGNAYSGATGSARGGSVINTGGFIDNEDGANVGGAGGESESGDANGGNA